jgi:hypothetical protein
MSKGIWRKTPVHMTGYIIEPKTAQYKLPGGLRNESAREMPT